MSQDEGTQDGQQNEAQETEQISHTNGEMTNRVKALEENNAVLQLLAVPGVREAIEASRAGKKVKVEIETEVEPPQEEEVSLTEGLEETDPARPTLDRIQKLVTSKMDRKDAEIEQLKSRLAQVETVASVVQKRDVEDQVTSAQTKYKDFPKYKSEMIKLSGQNPGLKVDQLYILAKHNSGNLKMVEQMTAQERPSHQPPRQARDPKAPPIQHGKKGFTQLLQERLKSLDLDSLD